MELIPPPQEEDDEVKSSLLSNEILLYSGGVGGIIAILVLVLLLKKKQPSTITENEVVPERSAQQLAYEAKMLEMGWEADKAREYADQHFGTSPPQ